MVAEDASSLVGEASLIEGKKTYLTLEIGRSSFVIGGMNRLKNTFVGQSRNRVVDNRQDVEQR
jgi:hypothetical protein